MEGDFQIYDKITYVDCKNIYGLIDFFDVQAEDVLISDIFHKELESIDTTSDRYKKADRDYPCIVLDDMINPEDQKYRMIDGRHRLLKAVKENEETIECFVLSFGQIEPFIQDYNENI